MCGTNVIYSPTFVKVLLSHPQIQLVIFTDQSLALTYPILLFYINIGSPSVNLFLQLTDFVICCRVMSFPTP